MANYNCIAGVDYGAKQAGTTAIAVLMENKVAVYQSEKKKDADLFLEEIIQQHQPQLIGFDAPLSIPAVYINPKEHNDYFYRKCDRAVNAMSPMFLGGLTARAMALKAKLNTTFIETYPAKIAADLGLKELGYKKEKQHLERCLATPLQQTKWGITTAITNWHAFDSLLALYGAYKYTLGKADSVGDKKEGLIYF